MILKSFVLIKTLWYTFNMEKTEKKNYNKKNGVLPVIITLLIVFVVLASIWLVMAFVFPKTWGNLMYSIGFDTYAEKLYVRDYNKNGDINSLYTSLNIAIKLEDDEKIEELFEELHNNKEYDNFIAFIDGENAKLKEEPLIKASLLNEDNYLKNKYVKALINLNKVDEAFEFAVKDGMNLVPEYNNIGNFLFGNFITSKGVLLKDNFNTVLEGKSTKLLDEFYTCFNNLVAEFKSEYNKVDVCYIVSLGNRAQLVGKTLNSVLVALGFDEDVTISETLVEINENLSTKLMD